MTMAVTALKTVRRPLARERLTPFRLAVTLMVLLVLLVVVAAISMSVGPEHFSVVTILKVMGAELTGRAAELASEQRTIIAEIRLPRALTAIMVGAALSVAGAAYQALLRNPLADASVLGVSTGSAVGAIAAIIFAQSIPIGRPVAAFLGAVAAIAILHVLGQTRQGGGSERLILAGIITNAFLSSIVIFLLSKAGSRLQGAFSWLMGDLSGEFQQLPLTAVFIGAGIAVIYVNARSLNLLMIGEEEALALGVDVRRVKVTVFLAASLITGAAVAVSGVIGFVGLIVPHAIRLTGGSDNRLVISASALVGAVFLLLADTVARTVIAPSELYIGVVTSLVGAPIFVFLLRRTS